MGPRGVEYSLVRFVASSKGRSYAILAAHLISWYRKMKNIVMLGCAAMAGANAFGATGLKCADLLTANFGQGSENRIGQADARDGEASRALRRAWDHLA